MKRGGHVLVGRIYTLTSSIRRINVTLPEYNGKRMETGYTGNIRQPDHSSVQHPVAPLEAALRLPSGIKPPGNRSLG